MKPTTSWFCDTCGELIGKPEHGIVEWLSAPGENGLRHAFGLRLVHHCTASPRGARRCDYHYFARAHMETVLLHDVTLDTFLGQDGHTMLLSYLARDLLPKEEVLKMIMRLHTPGYEHARADFGRAIACGVFEPDLPDGYYWQRNIEAVLDFAKDGS